MVPHPKRPELDELRARIGRDLAGEAVRLRPLDRAALRRLAERMLPGYDRVAIDRVTRRVATDSAGMPLLAVELLRAVALGLDLGTISEAWPEPLRTLDQTLPGELPDAVVAAIRIGFRRLSPSAQRVLAAASVLGDLVAASLLEKVLSQAPRRRRSPSTNWNGIDGWWRSRAAIRSSRDWSGGWWSGTCSLPASADACSWRPAGRTCSEITECGRSSLRTALRCDSG